MFITYTLKKESRKENACLLEDLGGSRRKECDCWGTSRHLSAKWLLSAWALQCKPESTDENRKYLRDLNTMSCPFLVGDSSVVLLHDFSCVALLPGPGRLTLKFFVGAGR